MQEYQNGMLKMEQRLREFEEFSLKNIQFQDFRHYALQTTLAAQVKDLERQVAEMQEQLRAKDRRIDELERR